MAALAGPGLAACALAAPASGLAARPLGVATPSGVAATVTSGLDGLAEGMAAPAVEGMAALAAEGVDTAAKGPAKGLDEPAEGM